MLSLLTAAAIVPLTYGLGPNVRATYLTEVNYDGYIPLFGGTIGKIAVSMTFDVAGLTQDAEGQPRATSELTAFTVKFNGSQLPLDLTNAQAFFPKTTISLSPFGEVLKTDAPNVSLPFRLPGLDVKRVPDVTYLPLQFPPEGVEVGKAFTFKKAFTGSDVTYTVTPTGLNNVSAMFDAKMAQRYDSLENKSAEIVTEEKEAFQKVSTELKGAAMVVFDRQRNLVSHMDLTGEASSVVTEIKSGKTSKRSLKMVLKVRLQK
jgi:hypothetical protein